MMMVVMMVVQVMCVMCVAGWLSAASCCVVPSMMAP
jgi:hypothetical protein